MVNDINMNHHKYEILVKINKLHSSGPSCIYRLWGSLIVKYEWILQVKYPILAIIWEKWNPSQALSHVCLHIRHTGLPTYQSPQKNHFDLMCVDTVPGKVCISNTISKIKQNWVSAADAVGEFTLYR